MNPHVMSLNLEANTTEVMIYRVAITNRTRYRHPQPRQHCRHTAITTTPPSQPHSHHNHTAVTTTQSSRQHCRHTAVTTTQPSQLHSLTPTQPSYQHTRQTNTNTVSYEYPPAQHFLTRNVFVVGFAFTFKVKLGWVAAFLFKHTLRRLHGAASQHQAGLSHSVIVVTRY